MISTEITNASNIMLGSQEAEALYIGSNLIWLQSSPLPYDAEIEYLESTGIQYIDLNFYPSVLTYVNIDAQMTDINNHYNGAGSLDSDANKRFQICCIYQNKFHFGCGHKWLNTINSDTNRHIFELWGNGNCAIDNLNYLIDQNCNFTLSTDSMYIFAKNLASNRIEYGAIKIYSCKIYESDVLVLDLIPVRVGQIGYMYDKVSGQLFGNSGTGDFILGADKLPDSYTKLQYISSTSNGSLYIDLGVKLYETLGTNYDIAMKFNLKGSGSDNSLPTLFGCLNQTDPWPGTFIRISSSGATQVTGRYIGKNTKDNNLGSKNSIIELPVQTSPNKNVYNLNNSGLTHNWSTSLFCAFDSNLSTPFRFAEADLYYFKLFVEGVLVRDMVPCKNSSNVVGLYDLVEGVFYSSPNNATFVAGPVV